MRVKVFLLLLCMSQFVVSQLSSSYELDQGWYPIRSTTFLLGYTTYEVETFGNFHESHKYFVGADGLVEVQDSSDIKGIQLDFDFPYAGQYFDQVMKPCGR